MLFADALAAAVEPVLDLPLATPRNDAAAPLVADVDAVVFLLLDVAESVFAKAALDLLLHLKKRIIQMFVKLKFLYHLLTGSIFAVAAVAD